MYEYGQGATKDYKNALYWYRKAAEQGDALAQYLRGRKSVNRDIEAELLAS